MPQRLTKKNLKSESVAYYYYKPFWTDCLDLYEPLPTTLQRFLTKYAKEDLSEFAARCNHVAQLNMVYLIVEAPMSMMFSTNVDISAEKHGDKVNAFVNCATLQGQSLIEYLREDLVPGGFVYGLTDAVVDMPKEANDVLSVEQARTRGLVPYCYSIHRIVTTVRAAIQQCQRIFGLRRGELGEPSPSREIP